MAYGWSAKQMARVNARRARRGKAPVDPGKVSDDYSTKYSEEYEKYSGRMGDKKEPEESMSSLDLRKFCEIYPNDPRCEELRTRTASLGYGKTPRLKEYYDKLNRIEEERVPKLTNRSGGMVA